MQGVMNQRSDEEEEWDPDCCKTWCYALTIFFVVSIPCALLMVQVLSKDMGHNNMVDGSGTSGADAFFRDSCDFRVVSMTKSQAVAGVSFTCPHPEIFRAGTRSKIYCNQIDSTTTYESNTCNSMVQVCKFYKHENIHLNVSVKPYGSIFAKSSARDFKFDGIGTWHNYSIFWTNTDDVQLDAFILRNHVLCDYAVEQDHGSMTELFLNRGDITSFRHYLVTLILGTAWLATACCLIIAIIVDVIEERH